MPETKLTYLPLGGAGEIGMNMYLYGYGPVGAQRFVLVDCGVTFPDMDGTPGVDLIMADPAFIAERADRLDAIVITHAHEDHVGALGMLYPRFGRVPVYARRFTALIAKNKLERAGQDPKVVREVGAWPETFKAGPFEIGFVPVAHSIPEASALVIDTPAGRIVHSGDFKADPTPLVGEAHDPDLLAEIGRTGVKVLTCDSTNVFVDRPGRSEADIVGDIGALMKEATGLVVATTFASNIARLKTLAQAAHDAGRTVAVAGRAMNQMLDAARASGVLKSFPPAIDMREAEAVPREHLFLLATGSQGERRAATAQLAGGSYHGFSLREGDTFLFSSKTIPGNEVSVGRIINQLSALGVRVIDDADGRYHVSGHANRPDLEAFHALLKPAAVIPMHGEHRHLRAHAELATANGHHGLIAPNGSMVDLGADRPVVIDQVETGRLYLDGTQLIGALDGVVRERMKLAMRGVVVVSVLLEADGRLADRVWAEALGLPGIDGDREALTEALEEAIGDAVEAAKRGVRQDDEELEKLVKRVARAECVSLIGKKPEVSVLISRFED